VFAPAVEHLVEESKKNKQDDAIEFPVVTPPDLRHTAASLAISAGANPKAVQTMLGHASAVLTLDTYADLFPDDLELVAAALDQARRGALEQAHKTGPRKQAHKTGARICCGLTAYWKPERPDRIDGPGSLSCSDVVGVAGFEPTASSSRTKRATKLRHTPCEATPAYRTGPSTCQTP
jgi:hypothetical protein